MKYTRKLARIIAFEASRNNYFRQRITDIKKILISELEIQEAYEEVASGKE